tara:strand:+ start:17083 stop:17847 length:765 start_codon:yes stop_codon:yes gene_type:complete
MQLPNRKEEEEKFTKRMKSLSRRHRKMLLEIMGTPPNPDNVPEEFWQLVQREVEEETAAILLMLFGIGASTAATSVGGDFLANQDLLLDQAERYADERSRYAARNYTRSARDSLQRRADEWTDTGRVTKPVKPPKPGDSPLPVQPEPFEPPTKKEVDEGLDKIFGDSLAEKTAVDETTAAQFNGGEAGVGVTVGISDDDIWKTRPWLSRSGPCKTCRALNGTRRPVWSVRFPDGPGESVHPYCVCEIIYANERS